MIVFACKQCGKRHRRPDEAAGSVVFCACGQANRVPWESTADEPDEPREERSRRGRRSDPAFCLTHQDIPSQHTCADCDERFCERCVVTFQGQVLCAPCKNLRVRRLTRPVETSGLAVAALVVGLFGSPILFCTTLVPAGQGADDTTRIVSASVGMVVPGAALVLSLMALRQTEGKEGRGGRSLALTGAACAIAGLLWSSSVVVNLLLQSLPG